jgi:hypothetical protein
MIGEFYCDVCSRGFRVDSDDGRAVCPDCDEDVIDVNGEYDDRDYEAGFLDPLIPLGDEDSTDYE